MPGKNRLWYWVLAIAVALLLLYASLRGVHWHDVWQRLIHASPAPLALAFAVASCSLLLRAVRWRLLLRTTGRPSLRAVFAAISVGYCGNLFLPARAGELIRTLMISRAAGLSKTFVLTTALCERLSDAVALVLIASVTLLALPVKPGWFAHAAEPFAAIGLAGVLFVVLLPRLEPFCHGLLTRLPIPARLGSFLDTALGHVTSGVRAFHDAKLLLRFAALTATVWFADACTVLLVMRSLALPGTLTIALLLTAALALSSALPSTPGYLGVYQFVAVSVLVPFGFSKTDAIGYILLFQAMQYISIPIWAAWGALVWRGRFLSAEEPLVNQLKERSA